MCKCDVDRLHLFLLLVVGVFLVWSVVGHHDLFIWFLEVMPAVFGVTVLLFTYSKFQFTNLAYVLIAIECVVLIAGAAYTYAEMPLFNYLRDVFDLQRNYYDRVGHFTQGFLPAILAREVMIRKGIVLKKNWVGFFAVSVSLSISALYELLEFLVARLTGEAADAFLGTQGDVWDTQWDMTLAFIGAITALVLLSRVHDKQIEAKELGSVSV